VSAMPRSVNAGSFQSLIGRLQTKLSAVRTFYKLGFNPS